MKKELTPEQVSMLKEPLPAEAVKPHPTKTFLSSIKAIYVVERLNKVFGIGSWKLKSEVIDNKTAMIVVKSTLTIEDYGIELESYGGNDNGGENSKNHDTGDAYKGAVTDALTKICSYLEIGMDVFKGKKQPEQPKRPEVKKVKCTEKEINAAIVRINKGEQGVYEKMKTVFELSPRQDEVLYDAVKNTKQLQTA